MKFQAIPSLLIDQPLVVPQPVVIVSISLQADFIPSQKDIFDTDANDLLHNMYLDYNEATTG